MTDQIWSKGRGIRINGSPSGSIYSLFITARIRYTNHARYTVNFRQQNSHLTRVLIWKYWNSCDGQRAKVKVKCHHTLV